MREYRWKKEEYESGRCRVCKRVMRESKQVSKILSKVRGWNVYVYDCCEIRRIVKRRHKLDG